MTKMNPEVKARWVAALRSGEYQQGEGVLRSTDGCWCCLGVLADLAAQSGVAQWTERCNGHVIGDEVYAGYSTLPQSVVEWAGLATSCGTSIEIDGVKGDMPAHNDCHQRTFAQIADAIESQL